MDTDELALNLSYAAGRLQGMTTCQISGETAAAVRLDSLPKACWPLTIRLYDADGLVI